MSTEEITYTISLTEDAAKWLYAEMGRRPHDEDESREVWGKLHRELYDEELLTA